MPVAAPYPLRFLEPRLLQALRSLDLVARVLVEGMYASRHRCPFYGYSVEFKDYREYAAGDDPRLVDWKMLGRTERFYVRRFEMESNMNVVALLDASGSMAYRPAQPERLSKFDYARYLVAALAYLAYKQQDAPGLAVFDQDVRYFMPPRQGQRHLFSLLSQLEKTRGEGQTDLPRILGQVALRLRRRSLLALVSDCYGEEEAVGEAVKLLAARGHDLVVFHLLDEDEADFPFQSLASFRDVETGAETMCDPLRQRREYLGRLSAFRAAIRAACLAAAADYVFLHTGIPLEAALREYLLYRRRRG